MEIGVMLLKSTDILVTGMDPSGGGYNLKHESGAVITPLGNTKNCLKIDNFPTKQKIRP